MPFAAMVRDQYRAPLDAPVHILVEFSSAMDLSLDHHLETLLAEALNSDLASDVIIAQSAAHGKLFWAIREGLVEGHAKRGFHVRSDVSVKLSLIPEAASQLETMLAKEFPGWIPRPMVIWAMGIYILMLYLLTLFQKMKHAELLPLLKSFSK